MAILCCMFNFEFFYLYYFLIINVILHNFRIGIIIITVIDKRNMKTNDSI